MWFTFSMLLFIIDILFFPLLLIGWMRRKEDVIHAATDPTPENLEAAKVTKEEADRFLIRWGIVFQVRCR